MAGAGAFLAACFPVHRHLPPVAPAQPPLSPVVVPVTAAPVVDLRAQAVERIRLEITPRLAKLEPDEAARVAAAIVEECAHARLDPLFVVALIDAESKFDVEAQSPTGCRGLMQLAPKTFRMFSRAKRFLDPVENVRAGVRYLRHLSAHGFRRPEAVLLVWHDGPGSEEPSDEAAAFVPRVMAGYARLLKKHSRSERN